MKRCKRKYVYVNSDDWKKIHESTYFYDQTVIS